MPHELEIIFTLTGGLTAALVLGFITQRLQLSPIVGYVLAGIAVGPFTPGFVAHGATARQFAELGVILLMFGVGLQLHVKELLEVRRVVVPGAIVQLAFSTTMGVLLTHLFGWSWAAGVVFGLAISVASTAVAIRMLSDHGDLHTTAGHIAVGWLVVEDMFTVLLLVLLPALAGSGTASSTAASLLSIGAAVLKVGALIGFTLLVGRRLIPGFLRYVAQTRSRELFSLSVLVLALGIAVGAAKLFGASMALGAFLAGIVVGQSEFSSRAALDALPMRDAFAVLFFVSMGMLLDPSQLGPNALLISSLLVVILIATPLTAFLVALALSTPLASAVLLAAVLAQIGEFSFIVAALGRHLGVLPESATHCLVAASVVSITLNPILFRLVTPLSRWLSRRGSGASPTTASSESERNHRTILVGYGPIGRILARTLRENQIESVIIERNEATVTRIREEGVHAIHGDAEQREVLERAGVRRAGTLVFTASSSPQAVVRHARELNPELLIIARTRFLAQDASTKHAGANIIISDEAEVALAMAESLLRRLGATDDQLDRVRDRAREALPID